VQALLDKRTRMLKIHQKLGLITAATAAESNTIHADLEVQFARQTAQYKQVTLQLTRQGTEMHIAATVPATLSDFKIDPATLLPAAREE